MFVEERSYDGRTPAGCYAPKQPYFNEPVTNIAPRWGARLSHDSLLQTSNS